MLPLHFNVTKKGGKNGFIPFITLPFLHLVSHVYYVLSTWCMHIFFKNMQK